MYASRSAFWLLIAFLSFGGIQKVVSQVTPFDYKKYLFGSAPTLSIWVVTFDTEEGSVTINGVDMGGPTKEFDWDWGDGTIGSGFFPQDHTYGDLERNYVVKVTATYDGGSTDHAEVVVRFVSPAVSPIELDPAILVQIPDDNVSLATHWPSLDPPGLDHFDNTFFGQVSRPTIEYVLSVAATVERDFVNGDTYLYEGKFEQFMLRDPEAEGAYSLWFTDPVAFGAGDDYLLGSIGYSSLFHEMGHNFTLNTPAGLCYGGNTDGNGSAIYSESMAQIFQHAAGYEIVNNYSSFGLSEDLAFDIRQDLINTIAVVRASYERYVGDGMQFHSWNDPATGPDEAFDTFMTVAYKFCEHAENSGLGYLTPLKRMMTLLQGLNEDWAEQYSGSSNSEAAETFRSTLMVAALSYAFSTDLREEFTNLNFPIDDGIYTQLYESPVPITLVSFTARCASNGSGVRLDWSTVSEINNYGFHVQRRLGTEKNFADVPHSFVPGHGTTSVPQHYTYTDSSAKPGSWLYRLKQVDLDGSIHFTESVQVNVVTSVKEAAPFAFTLYQNYPNPFNPVTDIKFCVDLTARTTLTIFNTLGQQVAVLFDDLAEPGQYYKVRLGGEGLASGVYFYRLQSGAKSVVRRLLLLN